MTFKMPSRPFSADTHVHSSKQPHQPHGLQCLLLHESVVTAGALAAFFSKEQSVGCLGKKKTKRTKNTTKEKQTEYLQEWNTQLARRISGSH